MNYSIIRNRLINEQYWLNRFKEILDCGAENDEVWVNVNAEHDVVRTEKL